MKAGIALLLAVLTGCGSSPRMQLRELAIEEARARSLAEASEQAVQGAAAYGEELSSGRLLPSILLSAATLDQVAAQSLPMELPAKQFHSQLAGKIRIERLSDFRLLAGNTLRCRMHVRGVGVKFTGSVPSMFRKQVSEFVNAVEKGGAELELEIQLYVEKGKLHAKAHALSARLPTAKDSSAAGILKDEMNDRALSQPLVIAANAPSGGALQRALVTPNHVVLTYAGP